MDVAEHLDQLSADGTTLADAAERAGWDTPVPACPDWTVRELLTHVGGVHRWAADIIRTGGHGFDTPAAAAVGSGPGDDELLDWFVAGHTALLQTLRSAPADLDCAAFLPSPSPLAFWGRRQAHETAIHRVDAEGAAGEGTAFATAFAQDGIAELLLGFAARKDKAIATPGTIALAASDGPSWLVTFGGERIVAESREAVDGDATVSGPSSDIYRWLWNRPSAARVEGAAEVAARWRTVRVTWG